MEASKLFVPGMWMCPQCGFIQQNNVIRPGGVFVDARPDLRPCPNDGRDMVPVTWEEHARGLEKTFGKVLDEQSELLKILEDLPWQVWEMNDVYEWWMGRTRGEAVMGYLKYYQNWQPGLDLKEACGDAGDNGLYKWEEIEALNDEAMERHKYRDDDGGRRTFAEELARRVAEGPSNEPFASSEW